MPSHTPGPWKLITVIGGNRVHAVVHKPQPFAYEYATVAEMPLLDDTDKANARLIAAAPEMLEVLQFVRDYGAVYPESEAGQRIRAAIAKAEGEGR